MSCHFLKAIDRSASLLRFVQLDPVGTEHLQQTCSVIVPSLIARFSVEAMELVQLLRMPSAQVQLYGSVGLKLQQHLRPQHLWYVSPVIS
jgi:hypothetical protein